MQTFNGKVYEAEPLRLWLDYHAFARAHTTSTLGASAWGLCQTPSLMCAAHSSQYPGEQQEQLRGNAGTQQSEPYTFHRA